MRNFLALILAALAPVSTWAGPLPSPLMTLESLRYDEVCGTGTTGKTVCLDTKGVQTWIPDAVTQFTDVYATEFSKCGVDSEGVKCFSQSSMGAPDNRLRKLIEASKAKSVRTSPQAACGIDRTSGELACLTVLWTAPAPNQFKVKPKNQINAIGVSDSIVCWADGDMIDCRTDRWVWHPPTPLNFPKVKDILVGQDWICARSDTTSKCWFENKPEVSLAPEFLKSKTWSTDGRELCALTNDARAICANFSNGTVADPSANRIPSAYATPPSPAPYGVIKDLLVDQSSNICVLLSKDSSVHCWNMNYGVENTLSFSGEAERLIGSGFDPCVLLKSGQADCGSTWTRGSRSLPKGSAVKVAHGAYSRCHWNDKGIDCPGRTDNVNFKSVTSFVATPDSDAVCVIGTPANSPGTSSPYTKSVDTTRGAQKDSSTDQVYCFGGDPLIHEVPPGLIQPRAVSVSQQRACAISDSGVVCWGHPYVGVDMPTDFVEPKSVKLGARHACAIDKFGLICWGDIVNLDLQVPSDLNQPNQVLDFSVGQNRTCAITDSRSLRCWGKLLTNDVPPPSLNDVSSLIGSDSSLFCALNPTGLHCWGGYTDFPK